VLDGSNVTFEGGSDGAVLNVRTIFSSVAAPGPFSFTATTQTLYSVKTDKPIRWYLKSIVSILCSSEELVFKTKN
jgi:hypothetical protein